MRKLRKFVMVVAVSYGVILAALLAVMHQPTVFGRVMRHVPEPMMMVVPFKQLWLFARAGHLQVGDLAPDFNRERYVKHRFYSDAGDGRLSRLVEFR